jgi:beta-glucan synthesis-associated protein KRE6
MVGQLPPRPPPYRPGLHLRALENTASQSPSLPEPRIRKLTRSKRPKPIRTQNLIGQDNQLRGSSEYLLASPLASAASHDDSSPFHSPTSPSSFVHYDGSDHENWNLSSPTAVSPTALLTPRKSRDDYPNSPTEELNTQTVSAKYNISPSHGLLLYPDDVEKDDWLHNPDENDKNERCFLCNSRGFLNCLGLGLVVLGALVLFIGYPIL